MCNLSGYNYLLHQHQVELAEPGHSLKRQYLRVLVIIDNRKNNTLCLYVSDNTRNSPASLLSVTGILPELSLRMLSLSKPCTDVKSTVVLTFIILEQQPESFNMLCSPIVTLNDTPLDICH